MKNLTWLSGLVTSPTHLDIDISHSIATESSRNITCDVYFPLQTPSLHSGSKTYTLVSRLCILSSSTDSSYMKTVSYNLTILYHHHVTQFLDILLYWSSHSQHQLLIPVISQHAKYKYSTWLPCFCFTFCKTTTEDTFYFSSFATKLFKTLHYGMPMLLFLRSSRGCHFCCVVTMNAWHTYLHTYIHTYIHIPLIHQSTIWYLDMKQVIMLWKRVCMKQSIVLYEKKCWMWKKYHYSVTHLCWSHWMSNIKKQIMSWLAAECCPGIWLITTHIP
jgi:hypothetical protein